MREEKCYSNDSALTTAGHSVRSLYVHVPFCHTICGYCDFYSEVFDRGAAAPLVDALLAELENMKTAIIAGVDTIFVGGGTPTTLPPGLLRRLLEGLRAYAMPGAPVEFTSEANPATVTTETAGVLADCGVTRISIGAQSFQPGELRVLERIHRPEQVTETVRIARAAGIAELNLDLIFAVPGQSLRGWLENLRCAVELEPDHLSCYALTYERGTPLYHRLAQGRVQRIDPDLEAEMFEATIETLAAAGYEQYEISNYARAGRVCRHNLRYWTNDRYAGIGPSASGFVDDTRYKNVPDTDEYVRCIREGRSPRIEQEQLSLDQQARDAAMLGLRLNCGLERRAFAQRYGTDPCAFFSGAIRRHADTGLLEVTAEAIRLTRAGQLLADSVIADFL